MLRPDQCSLQQILSKVKSWPPFTIRGWIVAYHWISWHLP